MEVWKPSATQSIARLKRLIVTGSLPAGISLVMLDALAMQRDYLEKLIHTVRRAMLRKSVAASRVGRTLAAYLSHLVGDRRDDR